ncbi:MAG: hypothetical protein ACC631_00510 [Halocynthiibacter sp.]
MRILPVLGVALIFWSGAALAGQFDGVYRQRAGADCTKIGEDGGALKIADNVFYGVQSQCTMTRPVNVRGMNAVLFDMQCSSEGINWFERALFMTAADTGLIMVWNGYAFKYDRCSDSDIAGSAPDTTNNVVRPDD